MSTKGRPVLLSVCAFLVAIGLQRVASADPAQDLQRSNGFHAERSPTRAYHEALERDLLGDYGEPQCQMLVMPSFSRESAVYIVRGPEKDSEAMVVRRAFEKSLWGAMIHEVKRQRRGKRIPMDYESQKKALEAADKAITTHFCPIDAKVADDLATIWETMLRRARNDNDSGGVFDGTGYYFAHFVRGVGILSGETHSPYAASLPGLLVFLGERLSGYTTACEEGLTRVMLEEDLKNLAFQMWIRIQRGW